MGVKSNNAIINPIKSKNSPDINPVAVIISTRVDLFYLCDLLSYGRDDYHRLFISRLYVDKTESDGFSLTGPVVGAPYAVMLLETLIAWGARKIIYLGWCGAVAETHLSCRFVATLVGFLQGTPKPNPVGGETS